MLTLPVDGYPNKIAFRSCVSRTNETVIADIEGPGVVRVFWLVTGMGSQGRPQRCVWTKDALMMVLRVYFDHEAIPSIEAPLGALFGIYHDLRDNWGNTASGYGADTSLFKISENGALSLTVPMPFLHVRFTIMNEVPYEVKMRIWAQVSYDMFDKRCPFPETLRLKALYRMEDRVNEQIPRKLPHQYKRSYLVGHGQGSGYLLGFTLGTTINDTADHWFHNGAEMIVLDHTTNPRVLKGTGGEDFFGTSCWFEKHHNFPDWGFLYGDNFHYFAAYRFFLTDMKMPFRSEFQFSYGANRNFMQSVMYWYQRSPALAVQKALPPLATRLKEVVGDAPSLHIPAPTGAIAYWNISDTYDTNHRRHMQPGEHIQADELLFMRPTFGFLSLGEYFFTYHTNEGYPMNAFVFARAFYDHHRSDEVTAIITHDDPFKLFINTHLVYSEDASLAGFHTFEIPIKLQQGRNIFIAKVMNFENTNTRAWVFGLNLRFSSSPSSGSSLGTGHYLQQRGEFVVTENACE